VKRAAAGDARERRHLAGGHVLPDEIGVQAVESEDHELRLAEIGRDRAVVPPQVPGHTQRHDKRGHETSAHLPILR